MNDLIGLVDWSRAQFALTAMYHWLFVPLTIGLSLIVAIMETIYVRTGEERWKGITRFWMTLFGINFACGIATGLILEFEFGTNWSNYSWFVGDIFGAPLAIEGLFAFFMEATFVAVMFFGWNKVSKGFHLASSWLTALGVTLSALWILVANAWMQYPVGMEFDPAQMRNVMTDFFVLPVKRRKVFFIFQTLPIGRIRHNKSVFLWMSEICHRTLLKMDQMIHAGALGIFPCCTDDISVYIISLNIRIYISMHHVLRFLYTFIPNPVIDKICPLLGSKFTVHSRRDPCRDHCRLNRKCSAAAKRVH